MARMAIYTAQAAAAAQSATLATIPEGAAGVRDTLDQMIAWVRQYKINPEIRATAEQIISPVPAKDAAGEVDAIFQWVRDEIRYTSDVRDVETLKSPDALLAQRFGDCDDMSLLVATLLESIGKATRFVAAGYSAPGVFEHVYAQVRLGESWVSLEVTEPVALGYEQPGIVAKMIRHV